MSRKQYTTLTLAVTVQVPAGFTQAGTIELVEDLLCQRVDSGKFSGLNNNALTVKLIKKDITYL